MGVPKLFNSLINQYHHNPATNPTGYYVIKKQIENDYPTHLYLDFNGAIYQCIKPEIKTEEALIAHVIEYLENICKMIPNLEFVYIAMDGVPPMGKVAQQRNRRFHSICKNNRIRKINQRFGNALDNTTINEHIDTNMITPGTVFMNNLSIAIRRKCMTFDKWRVVFSDASIPGEGEHKIIKYIREQVPSSINTVIYALDGDLIFLSLGLHLENVYLFREANEYGNLSALTSHTGKRFLYMDINELERAIITNSQDTYGCSNMTIPDMRRRYIDDYIFLGMLLGNDFMPKCHWFSIAEGGFERLLSAYWQIHNHTETYLTNCQNDSQIPMLDTEMLSDILFIVKNQETEAINSLFARRKKARIPIKPDMSERERQQTMMDFLPLQYLDIEKGIEPHMEGWRSRYYKTCFNMIPSTENIQMVCRSYLKTLIWNFHYYFNPNGCISWDWVYDFPYCPTWSDVYDELITHKNINVSGSDKLFKFTMGKPLDAQTLLFMVLPWNSRKYMAAEIGRKLNDESCPMRIYFPKRYGLNVAFHRYYHECTPVLFKMDRKQIEKWLKDCKYSEDELKRNLVGNIFTNRGSF